MTMFNTGYVFGAVFCGAAVVVSVAIANNPFVAAVAAYVIFLATTPIGFWVSRRIARKPQPEWEPQRGGEPTPKWEPHRPCEP